MKTEKNGKPTEPTLAQLLWHSLERKRGAVTWIAGRDFKATIEGAIRIRAGEGVHPMSAAYYNEIDPYCAQWIRNQIAAGILPKGEVDVRSIVDVRADDLGGFSQAHFFAGFGGWALALRIAGWPDNRPIWTGSAPCQPFSVSGRRQGRDDARHLWPDFHRIIRDGRPPVLMGEQVAGALGYGWFDGVAADLEAEDYACRAVDIPACGIGAPHIRNRLYWLAYRGGERRQQESIGASRDETAHGWEPHGDCQSSGDGEGTRGMEHAARDGRGEGRAADGVLGGRGTATDASGGVGGMANNQHAGGRTESEGRDEHDGTDGERDQAAGGHGTRGAGGVGGMGDTASWDEWRAGREPAGQQSADRGPGARGGDAGGLADVGGAGLERPRLHERGRVDGPWSSFVLVGPDRKGKYRRVGRALTTLSELVDGRTDRGTRVCAAADEARGRIPLLERQVPARIGKLKALGNGLCIPLAVDAVRTAMEVLKMEELCTIYTKWPWNPLPEVKP